MVTITHKDVQVLFENRVSDLIHYYYKIKYVNEYKKTIIFVTFSDMTRQSMTEATQTEKISFFQNMIVNNDHDIS